MKNALQLVGVAALLGGLIALSGGCEADLGAPGPVVYGDVGYVGPWYYPGTWVGHGGDYAHPPYGGGRGRSIPDRARPAAGHSAPARSGGGGNRGGGNDRRH